MEILGSFDTSVRKALKEIDPNWESYDGLIVCGTHEPLKHDIEGILKKIKEARETGMPYLGLCWGYQLAAIEYARNVLEITDATSEEWGKGTFVVKKRKDLNVGHKGDMSYWNNYEVDMPDPYWLSPHFYATQGHPEYESSYWKPSKILVDFINHCKNYGK